MASSDNHVTIAGAVFGPADNDGAPELRYSSSGTAFTKFAVALYAGKNDDGSYKDSHFIDVVCFGDMAEAVAEQINKGDRVTVVGRLQQNRWETDEGQKRSKIEIVADEVGPNYRWGLADKVSNTTPKRRNTAPAPEVNDDDLF